MNRSAWGLTDIERRMADDHRRLVNVIRALLIVALLAGLCNYITQ